jgi:hypothetical protein
LSLVVLSLGLLPAEVRTAPTFTGLTPSGGRPRSLVAINDPNVKSGKIIWDAGQSDERAIATSIGVTMFSVPDDAEPGPHPVAIEDASGRSAPMLFSVTGPPLAIMAPRIDHVMPLDAEVAQGGLVVTTLYVQGANFDVDAVVEVGGIEVATVAHQALRSNLYGVPEADLGYPIRHYVSLVAVPAALTSGRAVSIIVRNADGTPSSAVTYRVPASLELLDSDGDALPDQWEAAGHDASGDGVSDTNTHRRDVFVELDVMQGVQYPPAVAAFDAVRAMFASAPMMNPYTGNGINLVITCGTLVLGACPQTVPAWSKVVFDRPGVTVPSGSSLMTAFSTLKATHFGKAAFGNAYHYALWAQEIQLAGSGISDQSPGGTGDDIAIGLDSFDVDYQTVRSQAEILAHEIGHGLGLRHGGATDERFNPNHWSVMSYAWALRTGTDLFHRRLWATCLPFYYAVAGQIEPGHMPPAMVGLRIDYSAGMAKRIVEGPLNEQKGVCNHPVDWDEDGQFDPVVQSAAVDANQNGTFTDTIDDSANWPALRFDGPRKNGEIP